MPKNWGGDDKPWREIHAKITKMGIENPYVQVGVLATGELTEDGSLTMVELAAIHEFGSPARHIPERSFIRFTIRNKSAALQATAERIGRAFLADTMTLQRGLELLGDIAVTEIKSSIVDGRIKQRLKPATIKAKIKKGSLTPTLALVDTQRLLNSITRRVINAGGVNWGSDTGEIAGEINWSTSTGDI